MLLRGLALFIAGISLCFPACGRDDASVHVRRPVRVDDQGLLRWRDTGDEVALFGVNYYAPHVFDYHYLRQLGVSIEETIDRDLVHFVRMGLDALRLHVFDREITDKEGNLLDNDHLRLLDYLIAHAKDRGIYTVLTPIAWWQTMNGEGFSTRFTMPQMITDPEARAIQCRYLTQFMNHVNAFTRLAYKDDPAIPVFELINEPQYAGGTTDAQVLEYVNALADAIRATGCVKPLFYNGWDAKYGVVRDARIEGSTFGWYPSGLCALRSLYDNFLPRVERYPQMRVPEMERKAKIVYEFDAADVPGSYLYPAIARAFREGGAQIATQFQYDPLPLAPYNVGWQTHYLNLVCAPNKAVSFAIACEAFHTLPRLQSYGAYPQNNRFGPFRVSYDENLSEMASAKALLYSNDTKTAPPAPDQLERIVGCGSSPVVRYEGTGAYFLDKLAEGVWRLEVYPDAIWIADPYGTPALDRVVSRIVRREWPMTIRLPDLGPDFMFEPLNDGNTRSGKAKDAVISLRPGAYLLKRPGASSPPSARLCGGRLDLREYVAPEEDTNAPVVVRHDPVVEHVAGKPLTVSATIAAPLEPETVLLHARGPGQEAFQPIPMPRQRAYQYAATLPGKGLRSLVPTGAPLAYYITVRTRGDERAFPADAPTQAMPDLLRASEGEWLFALSDTGADIERVGLTGTPSEPTVAVVPGSVEGRRALRLQAQGFPSGACGRIRVPRTPTPARAWSKDAVVVVRARSLLPQTSSVEIGLIESDGAAHGQEFVLTAAWRDIRIPLRGLRPLWDTKTPDVHPDRIAKVSILFGAWLYGAAATQPHGFEIESVKVAPPAPLWQVSIVPPDAPIVILDAERDPFTITSALRYSQRLVPGMAPDRCALQVNVPDGFGPPPSCIGFRYAVTETVRARRDTLQACTTLRIRARALESTTTAVEVVLIERDDSPWGKVVPLTTAWQEIRIPLSDFGHFRQWNTGPAERGGAADRFHPEDLAAVNVCFGAWLYPDHAPESHGIEIERVMIAPE